MHFPTQDVSSKANAEKRHFNNIKCEPKNGTNLSKEDKTWAEFSTLDTTLCDAITLITETAQLKGENSA